MAVRAFLYDAEGFDREIDVDKEQINSHSQNSLLWIDLSTDDKEAMERLQARFSLTPGMLHNVRRLDRRPHTDIYGDIIHLRVDTVQPATGRTQTIPLDFILGHNLVMTVHPQPVKFLEAFDHSIQGDTQMGKLDAAEFLASLLDWHVSSYFRIVEEIASEIDKLDERVLRARGRGDILSDLVALRRKVARVRLTLTPHREAYAALSNPEIPMIGNSQSAQLFQALYDRLERAIDSVEHARELLVGSFDIHTTLVGQRTNETMTVLTLATVALLPVGAIAGILGMNFKARLFNAGDIGFWIALLLMAGVSIGTILIARYRKVI